MYSGTFLSFLAALGLVLQTAQMVYSNDGRTFPNEEASIRLASLGPMEPGSPGRSDVNSKRTTVEAAVVRPYKQATIAAPVEGIIEKENVQEGDLVQASQVVLEISPDYFNILVKRARQRVMALEATHEQAERELKLKEYLLLHKAATKQQILRAGSEAKVALHRYNQARQDLALALRDLKDSKVRAPFTGYIVSLYRELHESVRRFDQLFLIADTSKVYVVANVPASLLSIVVKGSPAVFILPDQSSFSGTVAKLGKPIDPSSRTKKVYVLIDNSDARLEMGMIGRVKFVPKPGALR
jgi:RND family efflux transporter MFP subunit